MDNDIDIVVDIDIDVVVEDGNICIFGHRLISVSSRLVTSGVEPSSSLALHRRLYNCGHLLSLTLTAIDLRDIKWLRNGR